MTKQFFLLLSLLAVPSISLASDIDSGDTAWVLSATALVLFMVLPGLALFYGGLVRSRNVLSIIMQCFAISGIASVVWLVCGYSLAFTDGGTNNAFIGGFSKIFFAGVIERSSSGTIPEASFALFQMTFAIITPALVNGNVMATLPHSVR